MPGEPAERHPAPAPLRLFIAVELPHPARAALAAVRQRLAGVWPEGDVRWTQTDNIHLTLRFLGDTEGDRVGPLGSALDEVAAQVRPLALALGPVGAFPDARRPRVIWVGLEGESLAALGRLQKAVERRVRDLGWAREPRPFHPHLTLGRVSPGRGRPPAGWAAAPVPPVPVPVAELRLIQSVLSPSGAVYTCLHRAALPG